MTTFLYTMFEKNNQSLINHTKSVARSRPLFIVLPINQELLSHWSLAIFANVNGQLPQEGCDIDVGAGMFILYLDSAFSANKPLHNNLQKFGRVISEVLGKPDKKAVYPFYSERLTVPQQLN